VSAPQDVHALAAAYGIGIEIADLGDWGPARLIAEYDPDGPAIRVNARELSSINVERAIAHELYHHREAIGDVPRLPDRNERERAADAFAAELLGAP
jgi:Zn-dependent peptidase ImmA (M78 family)